MTTKADFYATVTEAVRNLTQFGYDSPERVAFWTQRIRDAAVESMTPPAELRAALARVLRTSYAKLIDKEQILKKHQGVSRFTLQRVKPHLHAELERRIMASANLITLNREAAIEKTIQRFNGWATSVPAGGSKAVEKGVVKTDIRKALAQLPFEERRVLIDQGHKFAAALSDILAHDGGAIAAIWHHHHVTYPRPEHVARDSKTFLIRGSWAHEQGFVKPNGNGYTDQITQPGEEVFCRCTYQYAYNLRDLPSEMVTAKGKEALLAARAA